ncbi:S8 family serine peptidase [Shewanella sp. JM162201]|uniref:S8 family serine peptidase n=1 Tax=Shewanella jiangmenensis TaxID=2837387 RepID=A0ABS5V8B7_9GAMM|nr:S8 family peptidase [Shewanella jiangmenensis]MBT1446102.1 S8 family serine peptidase [Shewanella jiangmenensis]
MKLNRLIISISLAMAGTAQANPDLWQYPLFGGDPLTPQQWHLKNTGQDGYSPVVGVKGQDLDVDFAHAMGIKGRGITVAVIDTGVEIDHEDLRANVVAGSLNLKDGSAYPTDNNGHGTAVAGIVASVEGNGIGGRGVAPHANLIGFNYLDAQSEAAWFLSHGRTAENGKRELNRFTDARIYNQSYGSTMLKPFPYDYEANPALLAKDVALEDVTKDSQRGQGSLFVKSAGNSYGTYNVGAWLILPRENGRYYDNFGLPFHSANLSHENINYWNMVVSATNATGKRSSYSSVGSNVWVAAPGGEYGTDAPAIITTDIQGCSKGLNKAGASANRLHGGVALDPNCNYAATMNGTSSAGPNAAGAAAVIMSANHALDARTVRHVLAQTARKTDANIAPINLSFTQADGTVATYAALPGWQRNAAGYNFHNFYGFGAVDVDAAVWKVLFGGVQNLPEQVVTPWQTVAANAQIPDATLAGVTSELQVADNLTVEAVQVKLNIDHTRLRDLAIELVSPSGTRSVLLNPRVGFIGEHIENGVLLSNHFYGENSAGVWTLRVRDTDAGTTETVAFNTQTRQLLQLNTVNNAQPGVVRDWSLRIFGH